MFRLSSRIFFSFLFRPCSILYLYTYSCNLSYLFERCTTSFTLGLGLRSGCWFYDGIPHNSVGCSVLYCSVLEEERRRKRRRTRRIMLVVVVGNVGLPGVKAIDFKHAMETRFLSEEDSRISGYLIYRKNYMVKCV